MNQSQTIVAPLGNGAVMLTEYSNTPTHKLPVITILLPANPEFVSNQGYADAIHAPQPAQSLQLHAAQTKALYDFLHSYFNS